MVYVKMLGKQVDLPDYEKKEFTFLTHLSESYEAMGKLVNILGRGCFLTLFELSGIKCNCDVHVRLYRNVLNPITSRCTLCSLTFVFTLRILLIVT